MYFYPAPPSHGNTTVISPAAFESIGYSLRQWGLSVSSSAYPAANLALYVPFVLSAPTNIQSVFWITGLTTGGNNDVGIYQEDGTKIVSLGSTARGAASSTITTTSLTDTVVGRGRYYMAFLSDAANNQIAWTPAAGLCEAAGVLEQAVGAASLPSTATFAVTTRAYIPHFGLYAQTITL